ncbi:hypothetical protein [Nocardioides solisilvae]|uniref:hypothetical protein n=1 Tax=Nocardioides solisilvae TaxID=1542435 RepID=UPI0013A5BCF0|nr:hypothetical protein [Nocardioides solisilvae]
MNSTAGVARRTLVLALIGLLGLVGLLLVAPSATGTTQPAPAAPDAPGAEPRVVVESARLVEATSLGTWFGGAARPVLQVVLYNNGQAALRPVLEIEWKDGNGLPNGVEEPELEELPPGTRATVEVPVQFNNFAQGQHTVYGVVRAGGREDTLEASTTLVPWGLYGLLVVALLAGSALRTRWAMTQMDREDDLDVEDESGPVAAPGHEPVRVGPAPLASSGLPPAEVEARALATMERFAVTREQQAVPARGEAPAVSVPQQRAPSGGRRASRSHKASTPWLTRR